MTITDCIDWDALWQERPALLRIAQKRSACRDDAEDAASEALVRAATRNPEQPGSYMNRIAVNLCVAEAAQRGYDVHRRRYAALHGAPQPSPEEEVCQRDEAIRLLRFFAQLPPRQREVLVLKAQGLSVGEIAALLIVSYKCVESLLSRARTTLRSCLSGD